MGKKPEILAPAGSLQALKAAVAAGCDAVYIGGSRFGARAYAENPKEDEMIEAIAYCHLHGVKLYMTVNTLLKNRELEDSLFSFLLPYYEAGLDAVIVQDVGVLRFVGRHFRGLPIHASTQMTLTMGKGAEILKKYHVTRIVPARELTIGELSRMRRETDLEMEVFVHGALCYCYSGQCLFSSMCGGRSGNRGRCAQPCRMPYKTEGRKDLAGDYLLSPKELCNLSLLPELTDIGIDSFKIEGRMKRPEYTAFVTSVYRKYTDLYGLLGKEGYQKYLCSHGKEWQEDLRKLAELYNRSGFTQGYLEGAAGSMEGHRADARGDMLASQRPKHGGVLVGRVVSVNKEKVIYRTEKRLSAQDVVEFRNKKQIPSYEYTVGQDAAAGKEIGTRYLKGSRIIPGDFVYRTKDAALLEEIRKRFLEVSGQVPVQGKFTAEPGKPLDFQVTAAIGEGQEVFGAECLGAVCEEAKKQPADCESARKILNQTGNSPFYFDKLEIVLNGGVFLPVGELKKLRRQVLGKLQENIISHKYRETVLPPEQESICRQADVQQGGDGHAFSASVLLPGQLAEVLRYPEVSTVYLHTEVMGAGELKNAFRCILETGKSPWLVFPVVFRSAAWERFKNEWGKKDGIFSLGWDGYLVKNMESVRFLDKIAGISRDKIRLDHNMYVMNEEACRFWQEQGIHKFTLPLEATEQEMEEFSFLPQSEILIYGKIPLMVSAQCIQYNTEKCAFGRKQLQNRCIMLADAKKRQFEAVNYCRYCYNIIYKKEPLYIKGAVLGNQRLGRVDMRYSFTTESQMETERVLKGTFEEKNWCGHFRLGIQ